MNIATTHIPRFRQRSTALSSRAAAVMALCAATAASTSAVAQATQATGTADSQLDPVTVTATQGQDTNTVVRARRIEVEQASSVRDLFKQTPEVHVSGGMSAAQKMYVRGLSERMLTVSIDGATQPESAYHHMGQLMLEPELIKRVEVEAGTGAATAGPGALAGALRLTTKSALDLLKPDEKAGGMLKAGYHGAAGATRLSAMVFGRIGRISEEGQEQGDVLLSSSSLKGRTYQDGHGETVPNTGSEGHDLFIKAGWQPKAGQRIEFMHEEREEQGLWNQRTNMMPIDINQPNHQKTRRNATALNYTYQPGEKWIDLAVDAFLHDNRAQLALQTPAPETLGTHSQGLNVRNVSKLGMHRLSYGFNHRSDTGYATVASGQEPDETARVNGLFLEDRISLDEQWQLSLGGRHDHYSYTDIKSQRFSSSGTSPSASLAWFPSDTLTLNLSHARALRGVGVVEPYLKQYQDNDSRIDPEKARNTELNATWQQGGWQLVGAVFRQRIDHFIGYDDVRDNMGTVRTRGFSASAAYKAALWSASLGVSQSRPTLNGQPLTQGDSLLLGNSDGRTWVAQIDCQLPSLHATLGWTSRLVEKLSAVPEGSPPREGYAVHDAYAQWQPTGKDDVTLTLTVKNLFDTFYYEQSSFGFHPRWGAVAGFPEPGRDIRVSAAWRF